MDITGPVSSKSWFSGCMYMETNPEMETGITRELLIYTLHFQLQPLPPCVHNFVEHEATKWQSQMIQQVGVLKI